MTLPCADSTAAARGIAKQTGWALAGVAVVIGLIVYLMFF